MIINRSIYHFLDWSSDIFYFMVITRNLDPENWEFVSRNSIHSAASSTCGTNKVFGYNSIIVVYDNLGTARRAPTSCYSNLTSQSENRGARDEYRVSLSSLIDDK